MQGVDWKKFLFVVVAFLLIGNLLANYFRQRDREASSPASASTPVSTQLRVLSSTQSADGVSESDLTPQLASALEKHGAGRIAAKLEALAKQAGAPAIPPQIQSESVIVQTQKKKLAIIRYEINRTARAVEVIGISGADLNRVMCTRDTFEEILLTTGPCAEKIREVHGVRIGG